MKILKIYLIFLLLSVVLNKRFLQQVPNIDVNKNVKKIFEYYKKLIKSERESKEKFITNTLDFIEYKKYDKYLRQFEKVIEDLKKYFQKKSLSQFDDTINSQFDKLQLEDKVGEIVEIIFDNKEFLMNISKQIFPDYKNKIEQFRTIDKEYLNLRLILKIQNLKKDIIKGVKLKFQDFQKDIEKIKVETIKNEIQNLIQNLKNQIELFIKYFEENKEDIEKENKNKTEILKTNLTKIIKEEIVPNILIKFEGVSSIIKILIDKIPPNFVVPNYIQNIDEVASLIKKYLNEFLKKYFKFYQKDQINFYIDKLVQLYKISTDETQVKNLISTFKVSYVLVEHVIKQQILNIKVDEIIKEINDLIDVCFDFSYNYNNTINSLKRIKKILDKFDSNPITQLIEKVFNLIKTMAYTVPPNLNPNNYKIYNPEDFEDFFEK